MSGGRERRKRTREGEGRESKGENTRREGEKKGTGRYRDRK